MSEAPERIWAWGWRVDSDWQQQTWQHEDDPMMSTMEYVRADLVEAAEQQGYASALEDVRPHATRIEELEAKLAACEKYRDAYAECDRIGTQSVREMEAKLAKAVEALEFWQQRMADVDDAIERMQTTLAELKGQDDG